jgi:3-hydroxybutyryl-CoA dehydrogenase
MGTGIALAFARAGTHVSLTTRRETTLNRSRERLTESLRLLVKHGLVSPWVAKEIPKRIATSTSFDSLDFRVDLVVESIAESLDEKRTILQRVEGNAAPHTIITTNTSSLPLTELSEVLRRRENFAGYHWFNPPEFVQLVEVVSGPKTREETTDRLIAWSAAIGKQPILIQREIEGFVANRLQYALIREAYALVERGICSIQDVDRVIRAGLGPRWAAVGPFESMDLAGLDVHWEVVRQLFPTLANSTEPPILLERLVEEGSFGAKSHRGLYGRYDQATLKRLTERRASVLLALERLDRGSDPKHR